MILPTKIDVPSAHRLLAGLPIDSGIESVPLVLSGETYLRVSELDLDDLGIIDAFVSEFGPLGGGLAYDDVVPRDVDDELKDSLIELLDPQRENDRKRQAILDDSIAFPIVHLTGDTVSLRGSPGEMFFDGGGGSTVDPTGLLLYVPPAVETVDEFRFAAMCIREVTTAWQACRAGDLKAPMTFLNGMLPSLLRRLSPQVDAVVSISGPAAPTEGRAAPPRPGPIKLRVEPNREPQNLPLYTLCALELFNHIVENAGYRVCANDRCRRTFVHQHGRAEKGQRRSTGVMYCTPDCARAVAQRAYRHRRNQAVRENS